jgi:hypothetical protein
MSNPAVVFNHDPRSSKDNPASHDDMSDVTLPHGKNDGANDPVMTSKVLKFSFVYSGTTHHQVAPSTIHTHWIQAVQENLGNDIVIFNNQNTPVEKVSTLKWTDPTIHTKQFKLYQQTLGKDDRRRTTYYILHRVLTNEPISNIKAIPAVRRIMKDYQFFITDHQWTETQWNTTRIGFVTNYDPSFYNRTQAQIKFNKYLHSKHQSKKNKKIPLFRMVFTSPQVKHSTHTVSTKAYAVEVLQEDAIQMTTVLRELLITDTTAFVPYTMRHKYPDGYEKAIRYQTHLLTTSMVIILQNISSDMMFYIQDHILQVPGVLEILASPKGEDTGRYSVRVTKSLFTPIRKTLNQCLAKWVKEEVQSDAQPTEFQFPGAARVKPLYNDGNSSGDNTWMTTSNASFMSMDIPEGQMDDFFATSKNATRIFSYAEILIPPRFPGHQHATSTDATSTKASISEVTAAQTETESRHKRDLERMHEAHQQATLIANATIAAQQLEIEQFKAQRLEDMAFRKQEHSESQAKSKDQDEATLQLRQESVQTKLDITALREEMQSMMRQFLSALPSVPTTPSKDKKRATNHSDPYNSHGEKRQDVRSTPGKKLYYEVMDLGDSNQYQFAKEQDDTTPSPIK